MMALMKMTFSFLISFNLLKYAKISPPVSSLSRYPIDSGVTLLYPSVYNSMRLANNSSAPIRDATDKKTDILKRNMILHTMKTARKTHLLHFKWKKKYKGK